MGVRKPHPSKTPESARAYLRHENAGEAEETIRVAEFIANALRRPAAPLDPPERKRALRLVAELRPLVARSRPDALPTIDLLLGHWSGPAKRGRRPDVPTRFVQMMLRWAARHRSRQLTVTELMAAAVATNVEPASDPRGRLDADALAVAKERMFDTWRKHVAREIPAVEASLAHERRRRDAARRAWESRSPIDQLVDAMTAPRRPWEEDPPRYPPGYVQLGRTG